VSGNYNSSLWSPYEYDEHNFYEVGKGSSNAKPK
jgi:hypothetical protein